MFHFQTIIRLEHCLLPLLIAKGTLILRRLRRALQHAILVIIVEHGKLYPL